jgi:hypothetical protein
MASLPKDVQLLKSDPASPAASSGVEWLPEARVPSGYLDVPERERREAWERIFLELRFVAKADDDQDIALWTYAPGVDRAPVVTLDSEGQLALQTLTFADYLLTLAEDPVPLREWCAARGIDLAPTEELARARVRLLPDPQDRWEAYLRRDESRPAVRTEEPRQLEDLLGMAGSDPRVMRTLTSVESAERPIEVVCDRWGRVTVLSVSRGMLRTEATLRGISPGGPAPSLDVLGTPGKVGRGWSRWDWGDRSLLAEVSGSSITRLTMQLQEPLAKE